MKLHPFNIIVAKVFCWMYVCGFGGQNDNDIFKLILNAEQWGNEDSMDFQAKCQWTKNTIFSQSVFGASEGWGKNAKVCLQSWVDEVLSTFIVAPPASTLVILSHMSFSNDDIIWKKTPFSCYNCMYCVELQQRASFASSSRRSFAVVGGKLRLSPLSSSRHNLRGRSFTPSRSWQRRRKKLEPFTSSNLELQLVEFGGIRKTREHAESRPPNFINDLIRSLLLFRSLTVFKVHHFWISFCAKWTIKLEF